MCDNPLLSVSREKVLVFDVNGGGTEGNVQATEEGLREHVNWSTHTLLYPIHDYYTFF